MLTIELPNTRTSTWDQFRCNGDPRVSKEEDLKDCMTAIGVLTEAGEIAKDRAQSDLLKHPKSKRQSKRQVLGVQLCPEYLIILV